MTGTGKGPLRIAIEDFFSTTKIGTWIAGYFKDWAEAQEAAIAGSYANLLDKLAAIAANPLEAIPKPPAPLGKGGQGEAITALTFAANIGSAAASAFMAPLMRLINYYIDRKWRTNRFDTSSAIQFFFRKGNMEKDYGDDLRDLGWSDERIAAWVKIMRPLPSEGAIVELRHRGLITDATAQFYLQQLGYEQSHIDEIIALSEVIPNVGDLITFQVREAFNDIAAAKYGYDGGDTTQVTQWAAKQGLSADWVKRYWRSHWQLPGISQGYDMLHRLRPGQSTNPFVKADMQELLQVADYTPFWQNRLIEISYDPYTRVDVRRLHKLKILTDDDVYQNYLDQGYDEEHAKALTKYTIDSETIDGSTKAEANRSLSMTTLKDVYLKHIWSEGQVRDYLKTLAFDPDEIDTTITVWNMAQAAANKDNVQNSYNGKLTTDIINGYADALVSFEDATFLLQGLGYTAPEIDTMLNYAVFDANKVALATQINAIGKSYVTRAMDYNQVVAALGVLGVTGRQQGQLFAEWDAQRTYRTQGLTATQYTSALTSGLISETEYTEYMRGLGYTDDAINLTIQMTGHGLTLANYNSAFKKSVITEADYRLDLAGLGYSLDDINVLVALNAPVPPKAT